MGCSPIPVRFKEAMRKFLRRFNSGSRSAPQQPPPAQLEQKRQVQQPITQQKDAANVTETDGTTLTFALSNQTYSDTVYAYITGRALDNGNKLFLLQADGRTPYFPDAPSDILQPLQQNCAISLGAQGNTVNCQIPHIAGGRIWFSVDAPLTFRLNPGPALVEPSVTNTSDPNINVNWTFAEFTWNQAELYANISYVDFVSLPVSLSLQNAAGQTKSVPGMRSNGLDTVCNALSAQSAQDGNPGWQRLIVQNGGRNLRALSPNNGLVMDSSLFAGYYDPYVSQVWDKFMNQSLTVNSQAVGGQGFVEGSVQGDTTTGQLSLSGQDFNRPSTADIFSSNSGPFATGGDQVRNAIIPRLAAAFNRSTLLLTNTLPADQSLYYKNTITNHYSRIVHEANVDGRGYAFPYDDVAPPNGQDQSGFVNDTQPTVLTVAVGGRATG